MKSYKNLNSHNLLHKIRGGTIRIHQTEFRNECTQFIDHEERINSKENQTNGELDLDEYDKREFDRSIKDPTDKTKPYDTFHTKVSRPDLKEQYEKRKDIFHTKDTFYLKKEGSKISEDKK